MNLPGRIFNVAQNPALWAIVTGGILGLILSAYLSGMLNLNLTRATVRNFQKKIASQEIPPPPERELVNARRLANLSIWGKGSSGMTEPGAATGLSGTSLPAPKAGDLALKGIIRYPDGTFEGAFFDKRSKKTLIVHVGDTVGKYKIVTIQPDQVVVRINGKEEAFTLFQEKRRKKKKRTFPGTSSAVSYEKHAAATSHVILPKKAVHAALSDMATFLRQVRIVPYIENGKPQGFQLLDIVPGSIVSKVGLKNGDVVERVNGKAIHSPEDAMKLFSTLESGKGVSLTVKRKGELATILVDLK